MVGYELLAETQRDLTAEEAAARLRTRPRPIRGRRDGDANRARMRALVFVGAGEMAIGNGRIGRRARARSWSRSARRGSAGPTSMDISAHRAPSAWDGHGSRGRWRDHRGRPRVRSPSVATGRAPLDPGMWALRPVSARSVQRVRAAARSWGCSSTAPTPNAWSSRAAPAVPIPDALSYEHAALVEPFAVALHAVAITPLEPTDDVVIVGAGPIGLLTLLAVRRRGAGSVAITDRSPHRLGDGPVARGRPGDRRERRRSGCGGPIGDGRSGRGRRVRGGRDHRDRGAVAGRRPDRRARDVDRQLRADRRAADAGHGDPRADAARLVHLRGRVRGGDRPSRPAGGRRAPDRADRPARRRAGPVPTAWARAPSRRSRSSSMPDAG